MYFLFCRPLLSDVDVHELEYCDTDHIILYYIISYYRRITESAIVHPIRC